MLLEETGTYKQAIAALWALRSQMGNTPEVRAIAQFLFDAAKATPYDPLAGSPVVGVPTEDDEDFWDE